MSHRREFLSSCGALVLALSGCRSVLPRTRLGRLALTDPHPDDWAPVLRAIIVTILPFDHPRFPAVPVEAIQGRLLALFPLEEDERFLVLQKGLMIFNQVDLFPVLQAPMAADERALTPGAPIAESAREDQRIYAEFARTLPSGARAFTALGTTERAAYFQLWGRSGFNGKRQFHGAARHLVMATAWSHEDFWRAIGYAGPQLPARP